MTDTAVAPPLTVDRVYSELAGPLHAFVRRRVSDRDAAEDIVADVMLRIHQHLQHLDDQEKVTAWMFRIARNAITDHYRCAARRLEDLGGVTDATAGHDRADSWLDDQEQVVAEVANVLRPLVDQLPEDYRRALQLTDLGGTTQADAARIEHVSLSGMKSRVQRGRRQLAVLLQQNCELTFDATGLPTNCVPRVDGCGCDFTPGA